MNKTNNWKLGLFVVIGLGVSILTLFWLGARRFDRDTISFVTYFDESVQGLELGSPVKVRGVTIGSVADITLAPDQRLVEVNARVYVDVLDRLGIEDVDELFEKDGAPAGLRLQLAPVGITGLKFLEVDFFDPDKTIVLELSFVPPRNYIPSTPSTLKSLEVGLTELVDRLPDAVEEIEQLVSLVAVTVEGFDAQGISDSAKEALDRLNATLSEMDATGLVSGAAALLPDLQEAVASARRLLGDDGPVPGAVGRWDALAGQLESTVADAHIDDTTASLRDTSGAFRDLAHGARGVTDELKQDLVVLREAMEKVRALADLLERDPGALLRGRTGGGAFRGN